MSTPPDPFADSSDPFADPQKQGGGFQQAPPPPGQYPGQLPPGQYPGQGPGGMPYGQRETLPNAQTILIMGILSIVFAGLIGMILAIITLSQAKKPMEMIRQYPGRYNGESNVKIGRVLAIISLALLGLIVVVLVLVLAVVGINS